MKNFRKTICVMILVLVVTLTGCAKKNNTNKIDDVGNVSGEIKEEYVTITFDVNGGEEIEPMTIKKGEEFIFPKPIRDGYKFNGWSNVQGTVAFIDGWIVLEDVTAFANWEKLENIDVKPLIQSKEVENGERTIEVIAKVEVPSEIKNDPKWNPNSLINGADYGEEKLLDERILSFEGIIKSNNQEHQMKIFFVGYEFTEYVAGIYEIEVDENETARFLADSILVADLDKDDGYTEILFEDKWELATDYSIGRYNGSKVENIGGFGTINGIEDLREKDGKFFVSRVRFEEETIIPEYFIIKGLSVEYKYTLSSNISEKVFTITDDTIKDFKANTNGIKVGDKIRINAISEEGFISERTFYGGTIYSVKKENGENIKVGKESVLSM